MRCVKNLSLRLFGREYEVGFGQWSSGFTMLLLVNSKTGNVLPAVLRGSIADPRSVDVLETGGIRTALEEAGVVRKVGDVSVWQTSKISSCEIVHPEILTWIKERSRMPQEVPKRDVLNQGTRER